ncbi:hypothetical protein FB567DRAFT_455273 [Paraphoma chrysanthemicola]|uniref:Uncharacterized protein n=1 Tax=Paraphoma chrysanthemicola TaxID=798071 RepID=A0A8K0QW88_9PLEO|nr:hypothetical protein FB567DRAFT_455273 [Paraphoma chrysanthemicola]
MCYVILLAFLSLTLPRGAFLTVVLVTFAARANEYNRAIWHWGPSSSGTLSFGADEASTKGTIWNAWLSNMPQILLSVCYPNLNTICTSMASSPEWNTLATSRKGSRVTMPFGEQRSTYFLQLPYKWALPLMVLSGALYRLLSQAFFLIRIDYERGGKLEKWNSACGISMSSLLTLFSAAFVLVCALIVIGRLPMFPRLPLADSCSLAISAACHPAADETEPHPARVQWGVVPDMEVDGHDHCSLSSKEVTKPEVGGVHH